MRGPNGAKEAGAFSGMDQLYWPPLCRVKATPEVRAVPNLDREAQRQKELLPWVKPKDSNPHTASCQGLGPLTT